MKRIRKLGTRLAAAACTLVSCVPALAAVDVGGAALDESAQVAGRSLKLNGAGVGVRFLFKVYAIGLYLSERKSREQEVLSGDGPRRLMIVTLRDIAGDDFAQAVMSDAKERPDALDPRVSAQMMRLVQTIAEQPRGLRKGDVLTMDWVPGRGAVVELNREPLAPPNPDLAFYNALLGIWLGEKPTDPSLKGKLLGALP